MRLRAAALVCGAVLAVAPAVAHAEDGYTTLLDGTATGTAASFDKWVMTGQGNYTLQADGSIKPMGGLGALVYDKPFGNVSFKVDFKDARTNAGYSNGGVMVRVPDWRVPLAQRPTSWSYDWAGASGPFPPAQHYQNDPTNSNSGFRTGCSATGTARTDTGWVGVYCGEEIQVNDSPDGTGDAIKTGSVYNFANLNATQSGAVNRYPTLGVWHTMEIRIVGLQYTVLVDGQLINQWDGSIPETPSRVGDPPTMARQQTTGYIGLQNHSTADAINYRLARVKELQAPPKNTTLPTVSGDGDVGHALSCSHGSWQNADASQQYVTEWFRSNQPPNSAPTQAQLATVKVGSGDSYTPVAADFGKVVWCRVSVTNSEGGTAWATRAAPTIAMATDATGSVGGTVGSTLSLSLPSSTPVSFGTFTPGVMQTYSTSASATVVSSAGDATLSVADPSATQPGHLVNGTYWLPQPLQAKASTTSNAGSAFAAVSGSPLTLLTWNAPVTNDQVTIALQQAIGAGDALRTGSYSKSLTFTLSTTTP
jgi:Domain of Unknown Function (DUF1080)